MTEKLVIDDGFIEKWHPRYDEIEDDEEKYKAIITKVSNELSQGESVSKDTLERIYNWKAKRAKGYVDWNNFSMYEKGFRNALKAPEDEKIEILDDLPGIGVPVASTILHFMYPNSFPIMDIRTVQVLHYAGYINSEGINQKRYIPFRSTILNIAKDCPNGSLRQIDRALFAYHKIYLEPKINGTL